jgi:hypothetical protein
MIHKKYVTKRCKRCKKGFLTAYKRRVYTHFCSIECRRLYYKELLASFNVGKIFIRKNINKKSKVVKHGKGHKTK